MAKRFLILNDEDLQEKAKVLKNSNTEKCEKRATRAFTNFLIACGKDANNLDFWNYEPPELDTLLAKFWYGARKDICENEEGNQDESEDTDMKSRLYSANSLKNFRYGLNRVFRREGHNYDITEKNSTLFPKSHQAYFNAITELKKEGKAEVKSKEEITEDGK